MGSAHALFDEFWDFIGKYDELGGEPDSLSECILAWLEHGNAVLEAGGDFGFYMTGVAYIIAKWLEEPSILDFKGLPGKPPYRRRTPRIVDSLGEFDLGRPLAFDPIHFRRMLLYRICNESYFTGS
jgi:hypothetical protein